MGWTAVARPRETRSAAPSVRGSARPETPVQERWEMLGVVPNVGESGFTTDTTRSVVDRGERQDLGLLSFWAVSRPSAAAHADVFGGFEDDEN